MSTPSAPERRGLSRPLIELIDLPSPDQCRTIVRVLGLVDVVQQRLDRECLELKATTGEEDAA